MNSPEYDRAVEEPGALFLGLAKSSLSIETAILLAAGSKGVSQVLACGGKTGTPHLQLKIGLETPPSRKTGNVVLMARVSTEMSQIQGLFRSSAGHHNQKAI
jgi:hypothetical protein